MQRSEGGGSSNNKAQNLGAGQSGIGMSTESEEADDEGLMFPQMWCNGESQRLGFPMNGCLYALLGFTEEDG